MGEGNNKMHRPPTRNQGAKWNWQLPNPSYPSSLAQCAPKPTGGGGGGASFITLDSKKDVQYVDGMEDTLSPSFFLPFFFPLH